MLETAIRTLFDYQRFEGNPVLQTVIDEVLERYPQEKILPLSDDSLACAAGGTREMKENTQEPAYDGHGTV